VSAIRRFMPAGASDVVSRANGQNLPALDGEGARGVDRVAFVHDNHDAIEDEQVGVGHSR
jgi:hypothetical protein